MLNATWWVLPYRPMSFFNCNECTELFVNFTKQILFVQKYIKGFQVLGLERSYFRCVMKTSSSGNVFRVTGPWCGNSPVTGEFPAQRPVTRTFDVFFDLLLNKRLSKQWWMFLQQFTLAYWRGDVNETRMWDINCLHNFYLVSIFESCLCHALGLHHER